MKIPLHVVLLTDNTDVRARKGRLGLIKKEAAATALIPGLEVGVEGIGDDKGQQSGRAQNRRVVVKVLVNRGLAEL